MNNIPRDICPFCNSKITSNSNRHKCSLNSCKNKYDILIIDNEIFANTFCIDDWTITNYLTGNTATFFDYENNRKSIELWLIDWDYSSVQAIENQLKLLLTFL